MKPFSHPLLGVSVLTAVLIAAIAGAHPAHADTPPQSVHMSSSSQEEEDAPNWNCATDGSHVCGPHNTDGLSAGCYDGAVLVIAWTRYDDPQADPLYGQLNGPCKGMAPTQEQESDAAYAAAQH